MTIKFHYESSKTERLDRVATDGQVDKALWSPMLMLIQNIYRLWSRICGYDKVRCKLLATLIYPLQRYKKTNYFL